MLHILFRELTAERDALAIAASVFARCMSLRAIDTLCHSWRRGFCRCSCCLVTRDELESDSSRSSRYGRSSLMIDARRARALEPTDVVLPSAIEDAGIAERAE